MHSNIASRTTRPLFAYETTNRESPTAADSRAPDAAFSHTRRRAQPASCNSPRRAHLMRTRATRLKCYASLFA